MHYNASTSLMGFFLQIPLIKPFFQSRVSRNYVFPRDLHVSYGDDVIISKLSLVKRRKENGNETISQLNRICLHLLNFSS
jgi:hypothetical protein